MDPMVLQFQTLDLPQRFHLPSVWEATEAESSTPETQVQLAFARHVLTGIEDGGLRFVDRNLLQNNLI